MSTATVVEPARPRVARATQGIYVASWIETHCIYPGGRWRGQPFVLLPWQRAFIYRLFEADPVTRERLYRWCLLGVPKKSGKSSLAGALACYFAAGDNEPNALVVCAAAAEKQADVVYGAAKTICELSPTLSVLTAGTRYAKEIVFPSADDSKIVRLAAEADTLDGPDIHAAILDELHRWKPGKGTETWETVTNGIGARTQPMVLQITTAGHDLDTVCGAQYLHGQAVSERRDRIANGEVDDDGGPLEELDPYSYFEWHAAPEDADYKSPETWAAANPSFGVTVVEKFFADQLTKKSEAVFRRFFLNQWTSADEQLIKTDDWMACADPGAPELDPAKPLYAFVDFGQKRDSAAVGKVQWLDDERVIVEAAVWSNPWPRAHPLYTQWKLEHAAVENHVRELHETFPVDAAEVDGAPMPGPAVGYDPWRFERSAEDLVGDGVNMVEVPQTDAQMVPACETFVEFVQSTTADGTSRRLVHRGDPVLTRHVFAVEEKPTTRGSRFARRRGSSRHIDAAIAVAGALRLAVLSRGTGPWSGDLLWTEENAPADETVSV